MFKKFVDAQIQNGGVKRVSYGPLHNDGCQSYGFKLSHK